MALISRVSRLFRADLHAVLDRIEEPDVMLKHAVREMEEDIVHDEREFKNLNIERNHTSKKISQLSDKVNSLDEEIDLCFESKNDVLARTLVKRKIETVRLSDALTQKIEVLDESTDSLIKRLDENRSRMEHMQQKIEILLDDDMSVADENHAASEFSITEDDIEVAFLREKKKRAKK